MAKDKAGVDQNVVLKNAVELKRALYHNTCNLRRARQRTRVFKEMIHRMEDFGSKKAAEWFTKYQFDFEIEQDEQSRISIEQNDNCETNC